MISIGVINNSGLTGKLLMLLWVNHLARILPIKFLQGTDEKYFENFKKVLKGKEITSRMYFIIDILALKKRLLVIEILPENLFKEESEINEDKVSLVESRALLYISNRSLTQPNRIIRLVLKKKGKRRILKKVVKDPFAIVVNHDSIITPKFLSFLRNRFKNYEIFRIQNPSPDALLSLDNETYIKPILWIFNKVTGITLSFAYTK